jgi:hypothetical protein
MDPFLLQWRLYTHNTRNSNLWSIKYNVYAYQHRHVTKKTTDSNYVYYDCRGAPVGDRGSMAWMPAYEAVSNQLNTISMRTTHNFFVYISYSASAVSNLLSMISMVVRDLPTDYLTLPIVT